MNVNYIPDEAEARENCRLLRQHLDLFKQAGVKASYWFTGLAAEQIHRLDPEFIRLLNQSGMPIAHHGANRPPKPMPIERVKGENWEEDVQAILDYESHALDPRTGKLDKTRVGGLKRMQQMFGNRIQATGRFFEASILYVTKQFGCRTMVGLKDGTGASTNAGWFLGMMGMPDALSIAPEMLRAAAMGQFDLSRFIEDFISEGERRRAKGENEVQSIAILIHDTDFLRGPPVLRQQLWETYERLVRWAAKHPRLQVVTFEEILDRIADDRTKTVSRPALLKAAEIVAASKTAPPDYVDLSGDYLSLADTFQAFAQSLRAFAETGKLPESVKTSDLLGPTEAHRSGLPPVMAAMALPKVNGEEVIAAAKRVCAEIKDRIPSQVSVGNLKLNPAEFLFAMAQTLTAIAQTGKPTPLSLHAVDLLPRSVRENRLADPLTKLQFWTFKPQRWKRTTTGGKRETESKNQPQGDKPHQGRISLGISRAHSGYFRDRDGAPVVLIGDYTWGTFSDVDYDFKAMFDTLKTNGLNFARVWVWWGCEEFPEPINRLHVEPYLRTGPGNANDGKPKYDLTRFNPAFFERLRDVCRAAQERGIFLQLTLFDAWMIKHPHLWRLHAYHRDNNVNSVDGDPRNTGRGTDGEQGFCSLGNPKVLEAQKAFIRKVVDAVNEFDNVFFEIANENYYNANWERHLCEFIHEYEKGKPKQHLVMPLDLPNHDYGGIKTWDLQRLHQNLLKARALKQPLIFDTDGIGNPDDATVRKAAWTAFVSGGHVNYLDDSLQIGTEHKGDFKGSRRAALRQQLGYLARFTRQVRFWEMQPEDWLVKSGSAFAFASVNEFVAYLPNGGNVTLDLTNMKGKLTARWFNPRDGKFSDVFKVEGGGQRDLAAPDGNDWVLYLATEAR
jgi:hypothetical protein